MCSSNVKIAQAFALSIQSKLWLLSNFLQDVTQINLWWH